MHIKDITIPPNEYPQNNDKLHLVKGNHILTSITALCNAIKYYYFRLMLSYLLLEREYPLLGRFKKWCTSPRRYVRLATRSSTRG